ncbi:MAG: EamA family transporter [Planctomycetota bacterium]
MTTDAPSYALGVAAGLFSAATWALGSHQFARLLHRNREVGAPAANLFKNGLALIVFAVLAAALSWPLPTTSDAGWLLLSGLLGFAVGDALYFAAFHLCGVQLAALSGNLIPPIAAVLAWQWYGETLTPRAILAMAVVLVGIVVVLLDSTSTQGGERPPRPKLGFLLAAAAAASQALAVTCGRRVMADAGSEFGVYMVANVARLVGGVGGALVIGAALQLARPRSRAFVRLSEPWKPRLVVPFAGAALVAAVVNLPAFTFALGSLPAGVSSVLFGTTPLWTLPIGLALGHRFGWKAWAGSAIAFGGLALLVSAG